jgi:hypothetical protein
MTALMDNDLVLKNIFNYVRDNPAAYADAIGLETNLTRDYVNEALLNLFNDGQLFREKRLKKYAKSPVFCYFVNSIHYSTPKFLLARREANKRQKAETVIRRANVRERRKREILGLPLVDVGEGIVKRDYLVAALFGNGSF